MKSLWSIVLSVLLLSSCVSSKKYNELEALSDKYLSDFQDRADKLEDLQTQFDDCTNKKAQLEGELSALKDTKAKNEQKIKQLEKDISDYINQTDELRNSKNQLLTEATNSQKALNKALAEKESELNKVAEQQQKLDAALKARESDITKFQQENEEKNKRIAELEKQLAAKEAAINNLRTNVLAALKGFSSDEVQVTEKNGNLHVSLSENLLFKSGSFAVDPKGVDALQKIAKVLSEDEDFTILVEGHTDDDPFNGTGQLKDNWDLSVKRATSVVRILVDGGLAPGKLSASGRGEFHPVLDNDTKENKAKNRRTEIILSPKLGKILDILNQQ